MRIGILILAGATLCSCPIAVAKDTRGLWFAAGSVGFHSTNDAVRNNADHAGDPRPDDFVSREMSIEDGVTWEISAGYGLTDRFSLQLDVGWFEGDIGDVDVYLSDGYPISANPTQPTNLNAWRSREATIPVSAGVITEIPVSLTGLIRFRTDHPLNPFIGAGFGMVFAEVEGGDVDDLNDRLRGLRIRAVTDERGRELTHKVDPVIKGQGRVPLTNPVTVQVDDAREFHLVAGLEYFLRDRVSVVADLRYTFADSDLVVEMNGEDQLTFLTWSEELFRPDGSLKIFRNSGGFPNPYRDPNNPTLGIVTCPAQTVGDFDRDGRAGDQCYDHTLGDPEGVVLVQGGTIDLSGFSARVGVRFHF